MKIFIFTYFDNSAGHKQLLICEADNIINADKIFNEKYPSVNIFKNSLISVTVKKK